MTFDDVLSLDDAALNLAIDREVYGYVWHLVQHEDGWRGEYWQCSDEPDRLVTRSSVPYFSHTASWERTMILSRRYGVEAVRRLVGWNAQEGYVYEGWEVRAMQLMPRWPAEEGLFCHTEVEERMARCRLALYAALQLQAVQP